MANLKGGTFEKQARDMHFKTSAFGESRRGRDDNQTHSSHLSEARMEIANSFVDYCRERDLGGKLNYHLNNENVKDFLRERTKELSPITAQNYVSRMSSFMDGLKASNVDMEVTKHAFTEIKQEISDNTPPKEIEDGRAIKNVDQVIEAIYDKRFESGVLADVQKELALRVAEAHELVSNYKDYIDNHLVNGLVGKGNHEYIEKSISEDLYAKIQLCQNIPSIRTYQDHLSQQNISSHDFRFTYAERALNDKLESGVPYHDALKEVSQELNHSRESMTLYYVQRA